MGYRYKWEAVNKVLGTLHSTHKTRRAALAAATRLNRGLADRPFGISRGDMVRSRRRAT